MKKKYFYIDYLNQLKGNINSIQEEFDTIRKVVDIINTSDIVFICGNGGSSAIASHISNDLQKMAKIRTICLSDNIPLITAYANDEHYKYIFSRQLETLAKKEDTLIVLSGSGNSENILEALSCAKQIGMNIVCLIGMDGGKVKQLYKNETILHINTDMQKSEEIFLIIGHILTLELINY